jgi:hypothetical protein
MACCGTALLLFAYRHTKDKNTVQREKSTLAFTKHNNDLSVTNKPTTPLAYFYLLSLNFRNQECTILNII